MQMHATSANLNPTFTVSFAMIGIWFLDRENKIQRKWRHNVNGNCKMMSMVFVLPALYSNPRLCDELILAVHHHFMKNTWNELA